MESVMNGVQKPSDVIAKGPHVYVEAEHKYREVPASRSEFPRAMYHETEGYMEANSKDHQEILETRGWQTNPFPVKPAKESPVAAGADLSLIVLQQRQAMDEQAKLLEQQGKQIAALMEAAETKPRAQKGKEAVA